MPTVGDVLAHDDLVVRYLASAADAAGVARTCRGCRDAVKRASVLWHRLCREGVMQLSRAPYAARVDWRALLARWRGPDGGPRILHSMTVASCGCADAVPDDAWITTTVVYYDHNFAVRELLRGHQQLGSGVLHLEWMDESLAAARWEAECLRFLTSIAVVLDITIGTSTVRLVSRLLDGRLRAHVHLLVLPRATLAATTMPRDAIALAVTWGWMRGAPDLDPFRQKWSPALAMRLCNVGLSMTVHGMDHVPTSRLPTSTHVLGAIHATAVA
jgi:hypothetical protein